MGKTAYQLPVVQHHGSRSGVSSRTFLCRRCSMGFYRLLGVKCVVVLIFSLAAFISAVYWVLPVRYKHAGFDAKESMKLSATVQAYFKLQKPVAEIVPYIGRLEYDVNEEIGVPSYKVAVLSMHQAHLSNGTSLSNWTDVVFGFIPDPVNSTMNSVALTVLKSSFVDLFLDEFNLTLTSSIFGEPSSFEILKFPGGITIIPERAALMLQIPQSLFNFTLNSSIDDIRENLQELKEQLKLWLHLMPNEVVYIQVTNNHGSTKDPPVIVEASVASDLGTLLPERLKQLAQIITGSPSKENLGLDHTVFGKVKEISLSSFLNHSLDAPPPSSSPAPSPSPGQIYDTSPSMPPSFSPNSHHSSPPCSTCYTSEPSQASPSSAPSPINVPYRSSPIPSSPAPSGCGSNYQPSHPPSSPPDLLSPNSLPHTSPMADSAPDNAPSSSPNYGSRGSGKGLVAPQHASLSSATARSSFVAHWVDLIGLWTFLSLLGTLR